MEETRRAGGMNDVIRASLEEVARFAGENAAIGTPIETSAGITVIPVCRVSVGFATGGVDFETASRLGRKTVWALSLPGKVAPITAGDMIACTIRNILKERSFADD